MVRLGVHGVTCPSRRSSIASSMADAEATSNGWVDSSRSPRPPSRPLSAHCRPILILSILTQPSSTHPPMWSEFIRIAAKHGPSRHGGHHNSIPATSYSGTRLCGAYHVTSIFFVDGGLGLGLSPDSPGSSVDLSSNIDYSYSPIGFFSQSLYHSAKISIFIVPLTVSMRCSSQNQLTVLCCRAMN
jgi:hypothetical protein